MATKVRASIKKHLEPALKKLGFHNRYPFFQRKRDGQLELVNLEHDKWGGGFFLEFAKFDAGDLHTSWGEVVPESEIDVGYTDPATRARLLAVPGKVSNQNSYFRYDSIADDRIKCDELVSEVIEFLPQVINWFERGEIGPNVVPFSDQ